MKGELLVLIILAFIEELLDHHRDFTVRAVRNFLVRNVNDAGRSTPGTLDLNRFLFSAFHDMLPPLLAIPN